MDAEYVEKRMQEIMQLIDASIMLTDNKDEILMLACAMMQRTRELFDAQLGVEARKIMFKEYT